MIGLRTLGTGESFHDRLDRWMASPALWAFLLASGVLARVRQYLFTHSYWYDEAFLVVPVRERGFAELFGPQPFNLVIPPAFLWVERALYLAFGDGEAAMRLPAFLAGIAALALMVPLARRVVGGVHAVWALALLAVSRHAIDHGCEAHPYTIDLALTEAIVLAAAVLLDDAASARSRRAAVVGLSAAALFGVWFSFPSAFVLGGVSLALLVKLRDQPSPLGWRAWVAFNAATASSALALWWFSARHMYYSGMIEHWGHRGWRGFPDWSSPVATAGWLVGRPVEAGNYGTRELGVVIALLAAGGLVALWRRSRSLAVLVAAPFALATAAALVGKYPLAHRTTMFLLPTLWLAAALGVSVLVRWGAARGLRLAPICVMLIVWDFACLTVGVVRPAEGIDYRGAYRFVHDSRQAGDRLWSQTAVVHETYYGPDASLLADAQLDEAVARTAGERVWAVYGADRADLRRRFESVGGRVELRRRFSGLEVILVAPRPDVAAAPVAPAVVK